MGGTHIVSLSLTTTDRLYHLSNNCYRKSVHTRTMSTADPLPVKNPSGTSYLADLPNRLPGLFDVSHSIRVVEVAKKYFESQVYLSLTSLPD